MIVLDFVLQITQINFLYTHRQDLRAVHIWVYLRVRFHRRLGYGLTIILMFGPKAINLTFDPHLHLWDRKLKKYSLYRLCWHRGLILCFTLFTFYCCTTHQNTRFNILLNTISVLICFILIEKFIKEALQIHLLLFLIW